MSRCFRTSSIGHTNTRPQRKQGRKDCRTLEIIVHRRWAVASMASLYRARCRGKSECSLRASYAFAPPCFTVDVCGVGGLQPDVPGYNIDYVKMNAQGGALEFSEVPFVVLDLTLSDGTAIDGILGMNFFWNRNIIFEPNPTGSGFLHVSDPVPYGNADFNFDGGVNLVDFSILASAWMSQSPEPEYLPVCDMYLDSIIDMKDLQAFMSHWLE